MTIPIRHLKLTLKRINFVINGIFRITIKKHRMHTTDMQAYNKDIAEKFDNFLHRGIVPKDIDPFIYDSWVRSRDYKIDPTYAKSIKLLSEREIEKRLNEKKTYIKIIRAYMQDIHFFLKKSKYLVYLTDEEGYIICLTGDFNTISYLETNFNFKIGASWNENAIGTTAVGVALNGNVSVPYMSSEKYCYGLRTTSCCAVPLKNADDELIGCIGIAANFKEMERNIFGIVLSAKIGIENQLRLQKHYDEIAILSSYYRSIFNSVSDAIITIDNYGIIYEVNRSAEKLINEKNENIVGKSIRDVLDFDPTLYDFTDYSTNRMVLPAYSDKFRILKEIPKMNSIGKPDGRIIFLDSNRKKDDLSNTNNAKIHTFDDLIGDSIIFTKLKEQAKTAAKHDANILITGDSGTGKELLAQSIHNVSDRKFGPFVSVNCGAIPHDLIESEFFGYERGAFTGANIKGRKGKFEQADGGTLFLDEIGEMPYDLQIRLLRVLQERQIVKIGGNKAIDVNVRIIAATNKNLKQEVKMNRFRTDLYFRLNVIHFHMPTLMQRKRDIPLLIEFFLNKYAVDDKPIKVKKEALDVLYAYNWPGNVRQLENAIYHAIIFMSDNTIELNNLPPYVHENYSATTNPLDENEKHIILSILIKTGYNITQAAKILNISRNTLYKKIKKHNIDC